MRVAAGQHPDNDREYLDFARQLGCPGVSFQTPKIKGTVRWEAQDIIDFLKPAREAAKKVCVARYEAFGCAGMASKIKPYTLEQMAERYKKGELNQIVN